MSKTQNEKGPRFVAPALFGSGEGGILNDAAFFTLKIGAILPQVLFL